MKHPHINKTNNKGQELTFIEVKDRQSTHWRRYSIVGIDHIDWNKIDAARALYAQVAGWDGRNTIYHYDIVRLRGK